MLTVNDGTDLFIDSIPVAEHKITPKEAGNKGVDLAFLPTVQFLLNQEQGFVYGYEFCEIEGVLPCSAADDISAGYPAEGRCLRHEERMRLGRYVLSTAKEDGHDQRMGEPDFDTVHKPIACTLQYGEIVMIVGVRYDPVHRHASRK